MGKTAPWYQAKRLLMVCCTSVYCAFKLLANCEAQGQINSCVFLLPSVIVAGSLGFLEVLPSGIKWSSLCAMVGGFRITLSVSVFHGLLVVDTIVTVRDAVVI